CAATHYFGDGWGDSW
nr:immunoglobulin heavy chain junction region [Macaca mulatta]MOW89266.1 immunoglobulin heavy chain junction region [Macaca mulatta]